MRSLRHPHVTQLLGTCSSSTHLYLVLEYASRGVHLSIRCDVLLFLASTLLRSCALFRRSAHAPDENGLAVRGFGKYRHYCTPPVLLPNCSQLFVNCCASQQTRFLFAEVVAALECVHAADVVFGDLKPENILLHQSVSKQHFC
jgi:serine/threonine protein kinase